MAGTIDMLAGAAAEVLPSPVGTSPNRSVAQRVENTGAVDGSKRGLESAALSDGPAPDRTFLISVLEKARNAGLSKSTSLTFERDTTDGRMYLYIRDRHTGEEVVRIPKKFLEDATINQGQSHRVDVRI